MNKGPASNHDFVFKVKADFLSALAHPARLKLIEALKGGEASVGSLSRELQLPQPSVSKHLAVLRQVGIVEARQVKVTVFYSVKDHDIFKVLKPISEMLRKKLDESRKALSHLGREK